jgi:hypothetical protein
MIRVRELVKEYKSRLEDKDKTIDAYRLLKKRDVTAIIVKNTDVDDVAEEVIISIDTFLNGIKEEYDYMERFVKRHE